MHVVVLARAAVFAILIGCGTEPPPPDVTCTDADNFLCGKPRNIAHRGGSKLAPENTLASFSNAVSIGADVLEMDVRRTADDVVVVMHDDTVDRTTDGSGAVRAMTFAELRRLDAAYRFTTDNGATYPLRGTGVTVPTLEEVVTSFPDRYMMIEIKDAVDTVAPVLALLAGRHDRVILASLFDEVLAKVRAEAPDMLTSMSIAEAVAVDNLRDADEASYVPPAPIIQPPEQLLTPETLQRAQRLHLVVQVWTVNDRDKMVELLAQGVDGIITDDPVALRSVIEQ